MQLFLFICFCKEFSIIMEDTSLGELVHIFNLVFGLYRGWREG